MTPMLLSLFETSLQDDWASDTDPRWYRGVHAGRILLDWREEAALPIFGALYRRGEDDIEWFEDRVALFGPPAVPVFRDVLSMETDDDWHYGRAMSVSVLEQVARRFPETRGEVIEALHAVLPPLRKSGTQDRLEGKEIDMVWTSAAVSLADLGDHSSRDSILAMYDAELIDETVMTRDGYLNSQKKPLTSRIDEFDLMSEIRSNWEAEQRRLRRNAQEAAKPQGRSTPSRTVLPKVERNAPCPCGSGKKYKHCCGKKN